MEINKIDIKNAKELMHNIIGNINEDDFVRVETAFVKEAGEKKFIKIHEIYITKMPRNSNE